MESIEGISSYHADEYGSASPPPPPAPSYPLHYDSCLFVSMNPHLLNIICRSHEYVVSEKLINNAKTGLFLQSFRNYASVDRSSDHTAL